MKFSRRKAGVAVVAGGAAVVAVGATVLAANAADPVAPEVLSATPAEAGHAGEAKYTAGDYVLNVHELDDDSEGRGTAIGPHTVYWSKTLHGTGTWTPTVLKFSVGDDSSGPVVFSYPVPAAGQGVDCVASGTEAAPVIRCETKTR